MGELYKKVALSDGGSGSDMGGDNSGAGTGTGTPTGDTGGGMDDEDMDDET